MQLAPLQHGQWPKAVSFEDGCMVVDGKKISYSSHDKPGDVPWDALGVELVGLALFTTLSRSDTTS
jgi:glyceraldehyde-3-phosphate dehydrogenase/erythrose-4-phosphate dehydrogenase